MLFNILNEVKTRLSEYLNTNVYIGYDAIEVDSTTPIICVDLVDFETTKITSLESLCEYTIVVAVSFQAANFEQYLDVASDYVNSITNFFLSQMFCSSVKVSNVNWNNTNNTGYLEAHANLRRS